MSAVLIAVFSGRQRANDVRTALVNEGFPTDRVELTSSAELGQAALMPMPTLDGKLAAYFSTLFQESSERTARPGALFFMNAVLDGGTVITVHPRGAIETANALAILQGAGAAEVVGNDLDKQRFEHAATEKETPIFTWIGKALAAPGAPDTTGLAKLP